MAQGGLPDQHGRERRPGIHFMVRQHAHGFHLLVIQEVGFVDEHHGASTPFSVFGGEDQHASVFAS